MMIDPSIRSAARIHPRLTFDEANIVLFNIQYTKTPEEFMGRLDNLLRHTSDSCLSASLRSLQEKLIKLSPGEFAQLREDCRISEENMDRNIVFPQNYPLPSL